MNPEDEAIQEETTQEDTGIENQEQGEFNDAGYPEIDKGPSLADRAAARAAALGMGAGRAARGLLGGIGAKLESPTPPDDDLRDLFEGPDMERDNDVYIEDLVTVEDEDVFGEGGADMSDILEVPEEEILGGVDEALSLGEERPAPSKQVFRRPPRPAPSPSGMVGLQL